MPSKDEALQLGFNIIDVTDPSLPIIQALTVENRLPITELPKQKMVDRTLVHEGQTVLFLYGNLNTE